jgi:hypothetical protein
MALKMQNAFPPDIAKQTELNGFQGTLAHQEVLIVIKIRSDVNLRFFIPGLPVCFKIVRIHAHYRGFYCLACSKTK